MAAAKKAVPKVAQPKFGEVGYKFLLPAIITETSTMDGDYQVTVEVKVGNQDDFDRDGDNFIFYYDTKKDLSDLLVEINPAYAKSIKQEELKKAQADVARLTKELAAIK